MTNKITLVALCTLGMSLSAISADLDPGASTNVSRRPVTKLCPDNPDESPILVPGTASRHNPVVKEELGPASPKWGADYLVQTEPFATTGKLVLDHAENGDIFVASLNPEGTPLDTFHIYKSVDHGETWSIADYYAVNVSGNDTIVDGAIRVGRGTNPWVYMFAHYSTSGGQLWFRRFRADYSEVSPWISIIRGDSLRGFSVDRNNGDTLFIALHMLTADGFTYLRIFASNDSGDTWANVRSVGSSLYLPTQQTQIATGGSGNVFISYLYGGLNRIRMRRYTDNVSPSTVTTATYLDSMFTSDTIGIMALAAQRPGLQDSQVVWLLNVHKHAGGASDIHQTYSMDGGLTWSATEEWPFNGPEMNKVVAKYAWDYPNDCVAAGAKSTDGLQFITGWAGLYAPGSWSAKDTVNDFQLTGMVDPAIDLVYQSGGTQVVYKRYATGSIYTDWWFNSASGVMGEPGQSPTPWTMIAQARPNPAGRTSNICFQLREPGEVRVSLYDLSGRRIAELLSGKLQRGEHQIAVKTGELPSGVYLYRIISGSGNATGRMVVAR